MGIDRGNSPVNRVMLLSGAGVSALATIRLAGPDVVAFLTEHLSRPALPGRLIHAKLRDAQGVIDDPIVALAGDSALVDITLHGGSWVVQAALECAERFGFERTSVHEPAAIGMFPEYHDVLEAEMQLALPRARTECAVRMLLAQPAAWREFTASRPSPLAIKDVLADRSLFHLLDPPTVAIIGEPNAGKSTLANRLFGSDRSIVSPIAGTTRDWVGEEANLDGLIVKLLDTPGHRKTSDPIERDAIAQSGKPIRSADMLIELLDPSRAPPLEHHGVPGFPGALQVMNKSDQLADGFPVDPIDTMLRISAMTGAGIDALIAAIHDRLGIEKRPIGSPRAWTARQVELLGLALDDPTALASL